MAALKTAIADIYEPEPWTNHFIEEMNAKNALIQSGIAQPDQMVADAVQKGGRIIEMPYFDDLPHDTASTTRSSIADDTDTEITPSGVTDSVDIAYADFRTKAWEVAKIVSYTAGQDPAQVVMARFVSWWLKEEQRILISKLKGIFAVQLAATHSKDISTADGANATADNLISVTAIEDVRFLLGDAYDKLTAMLMHSVVFKRLRLLNLIDFVPVSDQNSTPIPFFQGLRVFVDDTCGAVAGGTSGYVYPTYLFGQGAIARENFPVASGDSRLALVKDEKAGSGAGKLEIITRDYFVMHPRGIKWVGTPSGTTPSNTELEVGSNWTKVYNDKNIRIVRLLTNG